MDIQHAQSPVTFNGLICDIWRGKLYITLGALVGLICACIFLLFAIPHYKANMLVAPANPMSSAESSSLMADENIFALRHLVQRLGAGSASDFIKFENTYDGTMVARILFADKALMKKVKEDKSFSFSENPDLKTPQSFAYYLKNNVSLSPVGATAIRRLEYNHPDKNFAVEFIRILHEVTDELIRRGIKQDAQARAGYLEQTIAQTLNPEHRRAMTGLLMEQERLKMLASIERPFAAAVVEAPSYAQKASFPDRFLTVSVFVIMGAGIGFLIFMMRKNVRLRCV